MISSVSSQLGASIWAQTSALTAQRQGLSFAAQPASPLPSSNFEPDAMVRQISTQVQSSKSATEALQQVFQTLERAEEAIAAGQQGADPQAVKDELTRLSEGLQEVQVGLEDLKSEVGTAAADQRIFQQVKASVDRSVTALERVEADSSQTTAVAQAKSSVLSSISRMEDLSRNLEKASLNVMRISSAYVELPSASAGNFNSLYDLSTPTHALLIRQNLGVALDQVS